MRNGTMVLYSNIMLPGLSGGIQVIEIRWIEISAECHGCKNQEFDRCSQFHSPWREQAMELSINPQARCQHFIISELTVNDSLGCLSIATINLAAWSGCLKKWRCIRMALPKIRYSPAEQSLSLTVFNTLKLLWLRVFLIDYERIHSPHQHMIIIDSFQKWCRSESCLEWPFMSGAFLGRSAVSHRVFVPFAIIASFFVQLSYPAGH